VRLPSETTLGQTVKRETDEINIMRVTHAIVSSVIFAITSFNVNADYTVDKGAIRSGRAQDVVITISKNPTEHVEEVCLALTMAQILRKSGRKVNVTVFLRNDGVFLADEESVPLDTEMCVVPDPDSPNIPKLISLRENFTAFIDDNPNNLVNCPLCWGARVQEDYIKDPVPDFGVLASEAIPPLLLGADKVIDF
jgi:hypothetical protein